MAFDELKENFSEAEANARSYIETSSQFYKLRGFKVLSKSFIGLVKFLSVGIALIFAMLFLSIGAGFWAGNELGDTYLGFLAVGGVYVIIGLLLYLTRNLYRKSMLKKLSKFYFDEI
ncbi:phage holin family protein [Pricia sp. S334]|uniref:Phage holin family protein n=1 Tax=Pricia mediterranea TaxID=3076079 RepID=A0ABU3L5I3_9FLAO|nr:phage holin family protein [Pricia sp. S334]MDT7828900.1 phage holin family protein [Pricia sp. S334]